MLPTLKTGRLAMQYRGAAGSFRMPPPQQRERKPLPLRKQRRGLFAAEKEKQWPQGDGCGERRTLSRSRQILNIAEDGQNAFFATPARLNSDALGQPGGKHVQHRFIGDIHAATPGAAMAQSFYAKAASTVSREARARQSAAPTIAEALGKASASSGRRRPQRSRQHAVFAGICPRIYAGKARAEAAKHRAPPRLGTGIGFMGGYPSTLLYQQKSSPHAMSTLQICPERIAAAGNMRSRPRRRVPSRLPIAKKSVSARNVHIANLP